MKKSLMEIMKAGESIGRRVNHRRKLGGLRGLSPPKNCIATQIFLSFLSFKGPRRGQSMLCMLVLYVYNLSPPF